MALFRFLTFTFLLSTLACSAQRPLSVPENYEADIAAWRQQRMNNLLAPTGWLSLVGLHWLEEGANTFGSDENEDLVFPHEAPGHIGTYYLQGNTVSAETEALPGLTVSEDGYSEMSYGSLQWFVIERGGQYGIRVRDTLLPARIRMRAIPHYPTDPSYRVRASFVPAAGTETVLMRNVLGMELDVEVMGTLRFQLQGKDCTLTALDGGPDDLFLVFSDETTGDMTYGGGRYLYCPRPDESSQTILDFNKAYNPPCVFTDFATCLLPRAEDHLPLALEAGEQSFGDH